MRFKTLMRIAPSDIKDLVTGRVPALKALQLRHEDLGAFCRHKIHESVSKPTAGVEIDWEVHQVVGAFEAMLIEQLQEQSAVVTV